MPDDETRTIATSVDVARRAGVSQSAVSLVFGGKAAGRVGNQTQEAILRAARELGYQPNRAARTLRSRRSRLVALAVPDVGNPYFADALQGAEQAARQHGYAVMLASVRDEQDWQQVILDLLAARAVDGVLLFAPPPTVVQSALRGKAVVVDASSRVLPSLQLAIGAGIRTALEHLLALGHRKIAHLAAAVDAETFHVRHTGYRDALQAAGLPLVPAYQERTAFSLAEARRAAHRLLESPDPPSAIVCDSDMLAVGVYKAANDLHLTIPHELSVVGFDDSSIASILEPELTTVAIPTVTIGAQAFLLLLAVLERESVPAQTVVPLTLVIRASTTAPTPRTAMTGA
jgi:LacI family transcriptional regulator, repressor for deo operon, udp, cdd, tsx, nupC, and nupG